MDSNTFDNYELKLWLMHAGSHRREFLQKLKRDLEKLNLPRKKVRKALLQLITNTYVVINPLSKEIIRRNNSKDKEEAIGESNKKLMLFLDGNKSDRNDGKNKPDFFNRSENLDKYSNRKKKIKMDSGKVVDDNDDDDDDGSTLEIVSKFRCVESNLTDNRNKVHDNESKCNNNYNNKGRDKSSLDRYKMKRHKIKCNYKKMNNKMRNKEVSKENRLNEDVISDNNNKDLIGMTDKLNDTKLTSVLRTSDGYNNTSFDCISNKIMKTNFSSTVSNYENENNHNLSKDTIVGDYELKTNHQYKRCETIIIDKIHKNCNNVFNKTCSNVYKRKKKKILSKFRQIFGRCSNTSEEEEEESIINSYISKKKGKRFNKSPSLQFNNNPLISSKTQDLTTFDVLNEDIDCRKTSDILNDGLINATSSLRTINVKEFNNDQTICDEEAKIRETGSHKNDNISYFSTLSDNNKLIQIDDTAKVPLIQSKDNEAHKYIKESINVQMDTDSTGVSSFNGTVNDNTNVEVIPHHAIQIETLSERSNNNNNNNINNNNNKKDGNNNLNTDSDDSPTKATVCNPLIDLCDVIDTIHNKYENIEYDSETSEPITKTDTSTIDEQKTKENDPILTNIDMLKYNRKNINDYDVKREINIKPYVETSVDTLDRSSDFQEYKENVTNDDITKESEKNTNEDLSNLLQMNISQDFKINSYGNTISIQDKLETVINPDIVVVEEDIWKKDLLNSENLINKNKEIIEEESTTKIDPISPVATTSIENNDTCNELNEIEIIKETSLNTIDLKQQNTSVDPPSSNVTESSTPIKRNKIRVLSSAELGSRWCFTPVNTSANTPAYDTPLNTSVTEPIIPLDDTTELINDNNVTFKINTEQLRKDTELNNKSNNIKSYIVSIYGRITRLRSITEYLLTDSQNLFAKNQKQVNNILLNSYSYVLLDELYNLGNELELNNLVQVIQYAISEINDNFILPGCEPMSTKEIFQYISGLDKSVNKTFKSSFKDLPISTSSNVMSNSTKPLTSISNNVSISIAPMMSNVLNNPNNVETVLQFVPNLQGRVETQVKLSYNDLPKEHAFNSTPPNQNNECNNNNLQTFINTSNTSILRPMLMQSINKNVQDNRINNVPIPGQRMSTQITCQPNNISQRINNTRGTFELFNTQQQVQQVQQRVTMSCDTMPGLPFQNVQQTSYSTMPSNQLPTLPFSHLQNIPQRMYRIPCELLFQIWDQVTYCLEENFIDCTIHESYDKCSCILKIFQKEWRDKIRNFILLKSLANKQVIFQSKQAKNIYERIMIDKHMKELWQFNMKEKEHQNAMMILNQHITRSNTSSLINLETQYLSQPGAMQFNPQKTLVNVEVRKRSESHKLKGAVAAKRLVNSNNKTSDMLKNNNDSLVVERNKNTKVLNKSVSVKKKNRKKKTINKEEPAANKALENTTEISQNINLIQSTTLTKENEINQTESTKVVDINTNEDNLLPNKRIEDIIDNQQDYSTLNIIKPKPQITDIRTISQSSFNAMEEVLSIPLNNIQLSTGYDIKQNEIEIKIQCLENIICLNCPKISTVVCEICLEAHYCSKECAALYWIEKHHKDCRPHCKKESSAATMPLLT